MATLRPLRILSDCAVVCTKCYTRGAEAEFDDALRPLLEARGVRVGSHCLSLSLFFSLPPSLSISLYIYISLGQIVTLLTMTARNLELIKQDVPCLWKPTTDVTLNPQFHEWFKEQLARGVLTLFVGGCTTTSCVRVSSQARYSCNICIH